MRRRQSNNSLSSRNVPPSPFLGGMLLGIIALGSAAGCHTAHRNECECPPGHASVCGMEPTYVSPLGSSVHTHFDTQREHARPGRFVFYRHEWYNGGTQLGPAGRRHLQSLIDELYAGTQSIIIEPEFPDTVYSSTLDEAYSIAADTDNARKAEMIQLLLRAEIPNAESRVVLDYPVAEGLRGLDQRTYQNAVNGRNQGQNSSSGNTSSGSGRF